MKQVNQRGNKIKVCHDCKIELDVNNWRNAERKGKSYICKTCYRDAARLHTICTVRDGKEFTLHGNKRQYPADNKCESCKKDNTFLNYHHWNDRDISKGIWICNMCHFAAEGVEKGLDDRYRQLKQEVDDGKK